MGESSSVSEYKRHEEYLKQHTVYKDNTKLQEYFQRWERNKKVCITFIFYRPCCIMTEPFKITLAVVMYHACTSQYSTVHYSTICYSVMNYFIYTYTTMLILVC